MNKKQFFTFMDEDTIPQKPLFNDKDNTSQKTGISSIQKLDVFSQVDQESKGIDVNEFIGSQRSSVDSTILQ